MGKTKPNINGSGIRDTWKLWRHCMCRHGWYPLVVAPFITAAGVLDIYSSLDCNFIRVNVGFTPLNEEWSESTLNAGFWTHQIGATNNTNTTEIDLANPLLTFRGCTPYSTELHRSLIQGDRAWTAAAIMAYCSGIAGLTAMTTIWLMTICPLPACFVWPGVLLPAVLIGFLAGGAKFFIFDSVLCTNSVWVRVLTPLTQESAQSCSLQQGAILSIASMCCFFICICLIFYNVPEKRQLDSNYGGDEIDSLNERDLEKGPSRPYSHDSTMEMIPEELPYIFESPKNIRPQQIEERDRSIPNVRNSVSQDVPSEDRDDENDGLEAVMTKIGTYLKENGSEIDFEDAMPSMNKEKSKKRLTSPEKEIRRVKSYNKSSNPLAESRSFFSLDAGKSKYKERTRGKVEPTVSKVNITNQISNKEENQCDISAITLESNQVGNTLKSVKSTVKSLGKRSDSYRVY